MEFCGHNLISTVSVETVEKSGPRCLFSYRSNSLFNCDRIYPKPPNVLNYNLKKI